MKYREQEFLETNDANVFWIMQVEEMHGGRSVASYNEDAYRSVGQFSGEWN